jgi:hypothetical protein
MYYPGLRRRAMNRFRIWRAAWAGILLGLLVGFQYVIRVPASGSRPRDIALALAVFLAASAAGGLLENRVELAVTARRDRASTEATMPSEHLVGDRG